MSFADRLAEAMALDVSNMQLRGSLGVPRTVVQVWLSGELPDALQANRAGMQERNPGWSFELFDDDAILEYIRRAYGPEVLATYRLIDDRYGPAKADLFRYLRIFAEGGVYLDVKSSLERPLNDVLRPDDAYILSHWRNGVGEAHEGFGRHRDLQAVPRGEFQQWHVIAAPGHPFLQAVIERVLANIRNYSVWRHGVGKPGVLRVTGPIAYTRAIWPILARHPHRMLRDETELGLIYSIGEGYRHQDHFRRHYSLQHAPVVRTPVHRAPSNILYAGLRWGKAKLANSGN